MRRSFQHLDKLRNASRGPVGGQADSFRLDAKRTWLDRCGGLLESGAKQLIYRLLQGLAGAAYLPFEEVGNIVVDGQGSSHIMMTS